MSDDAQFTHAHMVRFERLLPGPIERAWQALTEADLLQHCKDNLTGYKRPKHVVFRTELPKTNVGKILRRVLRDEK